MTIGWKNSSSRPSGRTGYADNPVVNSKGMRNAKHDGFTPSDPRQPSQPATIERRDVPPSAPSHSNTARMPPGGMVRQVGHATDGSGRYQGATHAIGRHGSDSHHDPRTSTDRASGQAYYASGGEHGKPTKRPPAVSNTGTRTADAGALAGDTHPWPGYTGGKGPIT
jgi:hypothetical protein